MTNSSMLHYLFVSALALCLASCGGGGGNPGTCSGSNEVCGRGTADATAAPAFISVPAASLDKITCLEILALNRGDKVAALASAQDAYGRGQTRLDGDKDGIACNGVF